MKILLTNDDGIHAPGIEALHTALTDPHNRFGGPIAGAEVVWAVAPLTVQSATGHGVTFKTPLMVSDETVGPTMSGVAVDGRPADCVKLALTALWPERFGPGTRPDLVISGMNAGANIGINVIYSGTVAAAIEAAFLGVPSIAVSLHLGKGHTRFDIGAAHARRVIEQIIKGGIGTGGWLRPHDCISVNIPICEEGTDLSPPTPERPEIRVCPHNTHGLVDSYEKRLSPSGEAYYWSSGSGLGFRTADPGTDVELIKQRHITVTPLRYDLTQHDDLGTWRNRLQA
jgi:5'-nucleotidase